MALKGKMTDEPKMTGDKPEGVVAVGSKELLGCPWCGEQPEYQPAAQSLVHPQYGWPHMLAHNCKVYGAQIRFRTDTMKIEDTKEALFAAWNTRKQPNGRTQRPPAEGGSLE